MRPDRERLLAAIEVARRVLVQPSSYGFDNALQLLKVSAAGFAKPMQDEPSRLLSDANFLGELKAGNSLPCRDQQVHRVNPLVQRNVASLEYRPSAHRKVFLALVAAVVAASPRRDPLAKATDRALGAFRPQTPLQIDPRRVLIREHGEQRKGGNCGLRHTRKLPTEYGFYSQKSRGSQVYNSLIFH